MFFFLSATENLAFVARVGAPNLLQIQDQLHHLLNNQFCENDVILSLLIDNACTVQDIQTGGTGDNSFIDFVIVIRVRDGHEPQVVMEINRIHDTIANHSPSHFTPIAITGKFCS